MMFRKSKKKDEDSIDALVQKRKEQANDRNIFEKSKLVSLYLGSSVEKGSSGMVYDTKEMKVFYNSNGSEPSIIIDYGGDTVFGASKSSGYRSSYFTIDSYIPGEDWELELDKLYTEALDAKAKDDARKEREAEIKLAEEFGLSTDATGLHLKGLVESRKTDANDKKITEKVDFVANLLGKGHSNTDTNFYEHTSDKELVRSGLKFRRKHRSGMYSSSTEVFVNCEGDLVYTATKGMEASTYKPGSWEDDLDDIYQKEFDKKKRQDDQREMKRQDDLKKKFGL